ncbi:MAG: hypothetical protein ACKVUT_08485 [Gaiella sp.]
MPAAALAVSLLGGCSCAERVHVQNDTNEMLHVQLQLPKPEAAWACGCKCVYEALLGPGAVWNSARPGSDDQMDGPVEPYSDCAVVRARVGTAGPWARFTLCGKLVDDSNGDPVMVHLTSGPNAGLGATAKTNSGKPVDVSSDVIDQ